MQLYNFIKWRTRLYYSLLTTIRIETPVKFYEGFRVPCEYAYIPMFIRWKMDRVSIDFNVEWNRPEYVLIILRFGLTWLSDRAESTFYVPFLEPVVSGRTLIKLIAID